MAAGRAMEKVSRLINNDIFINVCLLGSFAALGLRSLNQEKYIETLESQKEAVRKTNKAMKKTIWDAKQQLYSQAEAEAEASVIPLSRLKSIFGDVVLPPPGEVKREEQSSSTIIV